MLRVPKGQKKNLMVERGILASLTDYVESLRGSDVHLRENEVVGAALLMFLAADPAEKLTWLERARIHDLQALRQALADPEERAAADAARTGAEAAREALHGRKRSPRGRAAD